jgi:DNA-dependent RNA polymerase auxiliary subunit epsilon
MTKEKKVSLKLDVRAAAAVRQVLFEAQRGYGLEYIPERIVDIRSVIQTLDDSISVVVESD